MLQLEQVDIQSDYDLKKAFAEHDLQTFYSKYVTSAVADPPFQEGFNQWRHIKISEDARLCGEYS